MKGKSWPAALSAGAELARELRKDGFETQGPLPAHDMPTPGTFRLYVRKPGKPWLEGILQPPPRTPPVWAVEAEYERRYGGHKIEFF